LSLKTLLISTSIYLTPKKIITFSENFFNVAVIDMGMRRRADV
jgi:hypothetical protein